MLSLKPLNHSPTACLPVPSKASFWISATRGAVPIRARKARVALSSPGCWSGALRTGALVPGAPAVRLPSGTDPVLKKNGTSNQATLMTSPTPSAFIRARGFA